MRIGATTRSSIWDEKHSSSKVKKRTIEIMTKSNAAVINPVKSSSWRKTCTFFEFIIIASSYLKCNNNNYHDYTASRGTHCLKFNRRRCLKRQLIDFRFEFRAPFFLAPKLYAFFASKPLDKLLYYIGFEDTMQLLCDHIIRVFFG